MDLKCAKLSVIIQTSHSRLGEAVGYCSYQLTHLSIRERFEEKGKLSFIPHWKKNFNNMVLQQPVCTSVAKMGSVLAYKPLPQKNTYKSSLQK